MPPAGDHRLPPIRWRRRAISTAPQPDGSSSASSYLLPIDPCLSPYMALLSRLKDLALIADAKQEKIGGGALAGGLVLPVGIAVFAGCIDQWRDLVNRLHIAEGEFLVHENRRLTDARGGRIAKVGNANGPVER